MFDDIFGSKKKDKNKNLGTFSGTDSAPSSSGKGKESKASTGYSWQLSQGDILDILGKRNLAPIIGPHRRKKGE